MILYMSKSAENGMRETANIAEEIVYENRADVLIVVGHGGIGQIEGKTGQQLCKELESSICWENYREIYILSCDSAVRTGTRKSLIEDFCDALASKGLLGIVIRGNNGAVSADLDITGDPVGIFIEPKWHFSSPSQEPNGTTIITTK